MQEYQTSGLTLILHENRLKYVLSVIVQIIFIKNFIKAYFRYSQGFQGFKDNDSAHQSSKIGRTPGFFTLYTYFSNLHASNIQRGGSPVKRTAL